MRWMFFAALLIALTLGVSAAHLTVSDPVRKTLENGQDLNLGTAGPGQKIVIMAERQAGEPSKNSANPTEALWDRIVPESLPQGWVAEPSKLYETPFQAFVTISPEASDGDYTFNIRTVDEYDGLTPITLRAKLTVSRNVLTPSLAESTQTTGVQQPAFYYLTLTNTGSASDTFDITPEGLPTKWAEPRSVYVRHGSSVTLAYPVTPAEDGRYPFTFKAESHSSRQITQSAGALLTTQTNVWNDARAASHGLALFPFISQPLYSLVAFLANLQ